MVCLIIAPFLSRPDRHAGDTREVFDGGLPYYSVCVSFNYFAFFLASYIAKSFRGVGGGFDKPHLRLMFLLVEPRFPRISHIFAYMRLIRVG